VPTIDVPGSGEILATVRSYQDFVDAFRAIKARLGLSNAVCDELGGLTAGHTDKLIGPTGTKNLSPMAIDTFCALFAVRFEMRIDLEQAGRMAGRWEGRASGRIHVPASRVSKVLIDRVRVPVMRELSARRMEKLTEQQRQAIARKAATARWAKQKRRRRRRQIREKAVDAIG
jgi:hypothetical protein